jgi:hypothetical protein
MNKIDMILLPLKTKNRLDIIINMAKFTHSTSTKSALSVLFIKCVLKSLLTWTKPSMAIELFKMIDSIETFRALEPYHWWASQYPNIQFRIIMNYFIIRSNKLPDLPDTSDISNISRLKIFTELIIPVLDKLDEAGLLRAKSRFEDQCTYIYYYHYHSVISDDYRNKEYIQMICVLIRKLMYGHKYLTLGIALAKIVKLYIIFIGVDYESTCSLLDDLEDAVSLEYASHLSSYVYFSDSLIRKEAHMCILKLVNTRAGCLFLKNKNMFELDWSDPIVVAMSVKYNFHPSIYIHFSKTTKTKEFPQIIRMIAKFRYDLFGYVCTRLDISHLILYHAYKYIIKNDELYTLLWKSINFDRITNEEYRHMIPRLSRRNMLPLTPLLSQIIYTCPWAWNTTHEIIKYQAFLQGFFHHKAWPKNKKEGVEFITILNFFARLSCGSPDSVLGKFINAYFLMIRVITQGETLLAPDVIHNISTWSLEYTCMYTFMYATYREYFDVCRGRYREDIGFEELNKRLSFFPKIYDMVYNVKDDKFW